MLSKEEIENSFIRIETICKKEVCLFNQPIIEGNLNQIKRYIIQLESNKQKLIEKLEEEKFTIESTYSQINGNYFMAQDKLDLIKQILSILKGESQVTVK